MNLKEAINVVEAMQLWRRGQSPYVDDNGFAAPMPHTPKDFGEALGVLSERVREAVWVPIDTAPMYVRVLVTSKCGSPIIASRTALGWIVEGTVYADTYGSFKITHWMPLPEPMEVTE